MILICLALLSLSCSDVVPASDWVQVVEQTRDTFYDLGRTYGVLACQRLILRQVKTGQEWTIDECYALADSLSQIETVRNP